MRLVLGAFVTAAIVTVLQFPDDPAAWSVVAVVVVVGYTAGASLSAGVNRMQGSIVGCLTGGITQMLLGGRIWLPIVAAIAVGLSVTFCRLLRIGTGFRLGGALAGFFIFVPGDQEWATIGWRLAATLIGISIALIIMLVWPARADTKVRTGIAEPLRDCVIVIDAAISRWFGQKPDEEPVDARKRLVAGTASVSAALAERNNERTGAWEPSIYSVLVSDLNDAMVTARRIDKVAQHRDDDSMFLTVSDPFVRELQQCRVVAESIASTLEEGRQVDKKQLLASAEGLESTPERIKQALDDLRSQHITGQASAEELQRLFGIALLLEHWSDAVARMASDLAEA